MRFLTPLFVALILLTSAHAALNITVVSHDTDVQSTYQYLKTCSCGGTTDVVRIKNIGDLEANYVLTLQGDQPWFTLEKNSVYLNPDQYEDITVFTNTPCGASGIGSYTVYVSSEYGRYRAISKTIETGVCENILFDVTPDAATVEPCGTQDFALTLTNTGTFRETYDISGLDFGSVTLDAGETRTITGHAYASCSEWGTQTIPIAVTAKNNKLASTQDVTVTVPRNYDYSVEFGDIPRPICEDVTNAVPVVIKNIEPRANTFTISGDPASEERSIYLSGMSEATVWLPFKPEDAGNVRFTANGLGLNGTIEKQATVDLPVEACYGFTVESPASVTACPGDLSIPFTLTSTGTQIQTLSLDVQANVTTSTNGFTEILRPSQQLDKGINLVVPDADREYYITLLANSTYGRAQSTTTVDAYSTESCYAITPTAHKFRIWTDQTSQPVLLMHTGIKPGVYTVHYNGEFMTPKEQNISLGPGQQLVLHFAVNASSYEPGKYLDRLTLSSHGVDYTTDFEITLAQKGFFEKLMDAWQWSGQFLFCSVLTILAAILLMVVLVTTIGIILGLVHWQNPAGWSKERIGLLGGAVIIVLLLMLIASTPNISRSYERPVQDSDPSALFFELGEGQEMQLNLSTLFTDPDADPLSYSVTSAEHVQVRIQNDIATIKPQCCYIGEEAIKFTANDRRGGTADSDLIRISVVPYKPISVLDYWLAGCWFATILLLLIAAVLWTLVMLFTPTRKEPRESKEKALVPHERKTRSAKSELLVPEDIDRPLTPLEQDVLRQAQHLVKAENLVQADTVVQGNVTINQGAQEQLWVASEDGTRFHKITCPIVKGMPKDKRVTFTSRDDAVKAGYTPCKTCSSHD